MKIIGHYLQRYKLLFCINLIGVFGFALVELGIPFIIADIIDIGIEKQNFHYIVQKGLFIFLIALIGTIGVIVLGYCCARISTNITRDIRNDIFRKAQQFTAYEFNALGISSMITRTNNDAYQIQVFVNVILRTALLTPIMCIGSFTMTARASLPLSGIIAATIPIIVAGVLAVAKYAKPLSEKQQASLDGLNRIAKENLSGIRVIRAFGNDAYEQQRFYETNQQFSGYSKTMFKMIMLTQPLFFMLMNIAGLCIYYVAALLIQSGNLPVGQLVAFMDYLFHAMLSVMLFCSVFMMYPRAAISARRIQEIFDQEAMVVNSLDQKSEGNGKGTICFEHVTFVYPDGEEPVLKDVSFSAKKGETIAFIGSTGCGKSTLVNLIPRFYDVSSGAILIDGVDIRKYDMKKLRDKLGIIPQKAMLFRGTILENIRFGKPQASMEEVIHAAKVAQGYAFIMEKEHGFEEIITEGATNVSGGQKQRLSIARALVRKPEIYIFDDSFSALDYKTDARLRKAIKQETKQSIVMVVAQRISTIMDADKIVVLHEGSVADVGTHSALLQSCQIYREIALSQLSEEEIAHE